MTNTKGLKTSPYFLLLQEQWQLLFELCHFTEALNPCWQRKTLQTKLQKLGQPLVFRTKTLNCDKDKLKIICQYFFEELGFKSIEESRLSFQDSLLPFVLTRRQSPTPLLMLILCCFLEECGLKTQNISCEITNLLKVQVNGHPCIIDVDRGGKPLKPREIVEFINKGVNFSSGWLGSNVLVIKYLNIIKELARRSGKLQILSLTHSYLMKYQPFNLKHLAGRAIISFKKGDYQKAIEDIRSYFQYRQSGQTNQILKKLYKLALMKEKSRNTLKGEVPVPHSKTL